MKGTRHKDVKWNLGEINGAPSWQQCQTALMMDIRDELQRLNALLHCPNFVRIPRILDDISETTRVKRAYNKKKKP